MTPQQEQKLRLQIGLVLGSLGMFARAFTAKDPALGFVIQSAMADVTGKHWDEYKTLYEALKKGTPSKAAAAEPDAANVDELLALLATA